MPGREDAFLIALTGPATLTAAELAALLRLLSADYKRVTRSELSLYRYETGSSLLYLLEWLKDIGEAAAAAERMAKFVKAVQGFFQKAKPAVPAASASKQVAKSMTKAVELAAEKDMGLKLEYKSGAESFSLELTPREIYKIHSQILIAAEPTPPDITRQELRGELEPDQLAGAIDVADRLAKFEGSYADLDALIAVIVSLTGGDTRQLKEIATRLDTQGNSGLASMIRSNIRPPRPQGKITLE